MKKSLSIFLFASSLVAQVQIGKNVQIGAGGTSASTTIQTNGTNNASQTTLNFVNPPTFNGLTFTFSNPTLGNETFTLGGTLGNAGLTNPSMTINSTTCTLGGSCTVSGGGSSVGTAGQLQMRGSTAGSFAASGITDNGTTVSVNKPTSFNDGTGNAGAIQLQQGTPPGAAPASTIQINAPTAVTAYSIKLPGAQGTGALTNDGAGNMSWTPGGGVLGPLQVPNLFSSVNPPSTLSPLTVQANDVFDSNTAFFSDGTAYNTAGANYASSGNFIADQMFACIPNPGKCSSTLLLNLLTKYVAAVNGSGQMPINLSSSITPLYYSSFDFHHAFASLDGTAFAPQMLYLYCQKFGLGSSQCSSAYTAAVAVIKSSWAALPRNGTTHLFTVVAGNEYLCATGFQEYVRNTGDVSNCNVWYASDMANMAAIATAQGDTANATFFNSERTTVVAAIRANLINGTTGLLISATLQNSVNDDIPSSALAVACDLMPTVMASCGILTSGQKTTIENYFNTNYATLVNANGFVLQTPRSGGWAFFGCIQAGGGGPYSTGCPGFGATQYQGGSWSYFSEFFALALGQVNPAKVAVFLNTNLNPVSGDPAMEWNDQGSTSLPAAASTNYMASVGWAVAANNAFPLAPTITAGLGCINKYGAQVNSGCASTSGLIYGNNSIGTANTPVVFDGGSTNFELFQMQGSSATGTRFKLNNGSNGMWFLETGSAFGAFAGSGCIQIGPTTGNVAIQCWQYLTNTTGLVSMMPGTSLKWSNTAGDPNQPQATGISQPSAGTVSIDSTTAGNHGGNVTLNNLTVNGTCTGCGGTQTIASGTSALGTSAIASGACATVVTTTATGTATTDVVPWGFNADPTSTTGYSPTVNGMLTIIAYPTANNVNFKVCNNTSASVTPGAVTLNWRIVR